MGNHWLDKNKHFCDAIILGLNQNWIEFKIEALNVNMPDHWKHLRLQPGDKYAIAYSHVKFLSPPTVGGEIEISSSHKDKYIVRKR